MSEQATEFNPNIEDEEEETEEPEEETPAEQPPTDDAAKLKKALDRERTAKKKALADLAELRKQAQQGDPNKGEMEKLTEQVKELQQSIATKGHVTALLEAGFNQPATKAERMLRMVDNFEDEDWIEELKVDYPERFVKARQASGERPHTGGGRDESRNGQQSKSPDKRHVDKLLHMGRN